MKQILLLVALMIFLVSCSKQNDVADEEVTQPPENTATPSTDVDETETPSTDIDETEEPSTETEETEEQQGTEENGEQSEEEVIAEKSEAVITEKDKQIYIKGITLGMSSSEVIRILGEPLYSGADPDGFYDSTTDYEDLSIGYYDDHAVSIYYSGLQNIDNTNIVYEGPKFEAYGDLTYLYSPEKEMLVKISPRDGTYDTHLLYEDENFQDLLHGDAFTPIDSFE